MLFISILLSVWFVLWIVHAVFVRDTGKLIASWVAETYEEDDEETDLLLDKSEEGIYHLSCEHCNHLWWSIEPNVNYCPNCGRKLRDG